MLEGEHVTVRTCSEVLNVFKEMCFTVARSNACRGAHCVTRDFLQSVQKGVRTTKLKSSAVQFSLNGQKVVVLDTKLFLEINHRTFCRFGDVFGPDTQPTEEEFLDFYAQILYNNGNRASHG